MVEKHSLLEVRSIEVLIKDVPRIGMGRINRDSTITGVLFPYVFSVNEWKEITYDQPAEFITFHTDKNSDTFRFIKAELPDLHKRLAAWFYDHRDCNFIKLSSAAFNELIANFPEYQALNVSFVDGRLCIQDIPVIVFNNPTPFGVLQYGHHLSHVLPNWEIINDPT